MCVNIKNRNHDHDYGDSHSDSHGDADDEKWINIIVYIIFI